MYLMSAAGEITNRRPVPPEWLSLLELAAAQVDAGGPAASPHSIGGPNSVANAVSVLEDERLAENEYFGLGQGLCEFAQQMQAPAGETQSSARRQAACWCVTVYRHVPAACVSTR